MNNTKIAFLGGAGKIGSAILDGLLESEIVQARHVWVTARHEESLVKCQDHGVHCTLDNAKAVAEADLLVLCVHPDEVAGLLEQIAPALTKDHVIISVVSGCSTAQIETFSKHDLRVIRAMPNTPVMVRASMTCLAPGRHVRKEDLKIAQQIFATVGVVLVIDERHMNAATGLGGCGPAFAFKIIEALSEGGVKVGLPREVARTMAAQVLKGAAQLVLETGQHPAALKDAVTTPGGCTIDGLTKLEERGLSIALIEAVEVATAKAGNLLPDR